MPASMTLAAEELEALYQATKRLETRWELPIPDATEFFAYDPLPWAIFLAGVKIAAEATPGRRFLDVGCGVGTKLAYMHYLGWQTTGIDRWPPYVAAAQELCPFSTVTLADLRRVEAFGADVVYMYRPGVTDATEAALEKHVVDGMTVGALLFLTCRVPDPSLPLEHVSGEIWRRI